MATTIGAMSWLWLGVFLLISTSAVNACINTVGRSTVSEPIEVESLEPQQFLERMTTHESKTFWMGTLAELNLPGNRYSFKSERQTNTAVALLHLGMVSRAIAILEQVERTEPGLYYTAANLGTAYELNGENAKALQWIIEGINRNADAHNGSEWLHVKILEAKLALEKDPDWLANNSVLELRNLTREDLLAQRPVTVGNNGTPIHLRQVQDALVYQLHERLEFIKPPDGVVADLLFDLSRTLALTRSLDHSASIAAFAQTYGPDLTPWPPSGPSLPAVDLPPPVSTTPLWIAGATGFVVTAVLIFVFLRRRKRSGSPTVVL